MLGPSLRAPSNLVSVAQGQARWLGQDWEGPLDHPGWSPRLL